MNVRIPTKRIPARGIGLGDLVKAVARAAGVKPCDGCERRRRVLNRYVIRGRAS